MDVTLVIERGAAGARRVRLRSPETIVGRQRGCDIRIPSAEVSRRHCLLSFVNGQLVVEDLESVNGTFVNQVRVDGRKLVRPGDHLKVGPLTFTVDYPLPPNVQAASEVAAREEKAPSPTAKPAVGIADDAPIRLVDDDTPRPKSRPVEPPSDPGPIPFQDSRRPAPENRPTEEAVEVEFDDSEPLRLPEGEDFRDLLSRMDE